MKTTRALLVATLALLVAASIAAGGSAAGTATITGSFADSCWDFEAHSSKDISHVVLHYADGRVVKDESTTTPDYSLDGSAGDELDSVDVKSGTTRETFECEATNSPPTAVLEAQIFPDCVLFDEPMQSWTCHQPQSPPSMWVDAGAVHITCGDGGVLCEITLAFRGINSFHTDGEITSWTIDFNGTPVSGSWTTDPPAQVVFSLLPGFMTNQVTLTVTDSAGQSDSDTMFLSNLAPD